MKLIIRALQMREIAIILSLVLVFLVVVFIAFMPDVSRLRTENPKKTSFMEYREQQRKEKGRQYRIAHSWVPLSAISSYLVKAVLIAEDDKFWKHEGFDYEAIQKAIEKDIKAKKFKLGGSTISQQLVKNLYLNPSKNPLRKIAEAAITWKMERVLSKKRILELYLNLIEWGEGIYGIEAAARHHFGKSASALTAEESARLAAVLPSPLRYSPTGEQQYVVNRSNLIYSIMVKRGIVIPGYREMTGGDAPSFESEAGSGSRVPIEKLNPGE